MYVYTRTYRRCVVAHEVRLLASNSEADGGTNAEEYLNALAEACGRYII